MTGMRRSLMMTSYGDLCNFSIAIAPLTAISTMMAFRLHKIGQRLGKFDFIVDQKNLEAFAASVTVSEAELASASAAACARRQRCDEGRAAARRIFQQ